MSNSTNRVLLSTAYLPPIDYFRVIVANEKSWQLEVWDSYQKQSYRNRAHIYSANGLLPLTVPISRREGSSPPIGETKIDNSYNWQIRQWRALTSAYNSTPFFDYYQEYFAPFYNEKYSSLLNFNRELLKLTLSLLGLSDSVVESGEYVTEWGEGDYRELIHPKRTSPFKKERGYFQPFAPRHGFIGNLSIVDLLFNEGPNALLYLKENSPL